MLWKAENLGSKTPHALIFYYVVALNAIFWYPWPSRASWNEKRLFNYEKNDEGVEFVPFTEGPKKTRQGGL